MKKRIMSLLLCAVMSVMVFTYTGCGDSSDSKETAAEDDEEDDKKKEEREAEKEKRKAEREKEEAEKKAEEALDDSENLEFGLDEPEDETEDFSFSTKEYASLEEYVSSDEVQQEIESALSAFGDMGMEMDIFADGNKLVYYYRYTDITETEGMAELLEEQLVAQEATFKMIASSLKLVVDVEDPVVVITYADANDEIIYSQEFAAE